MQIRVRGFAIGGAILVFCIWTLATWLLEGRNETLLTGDAGERAIYAMVANLLIGVGGGCLIVRRLVRKGLVEKEASGFGGRARSPIYIAAAGILGFGLCWIQGAPTTDPMVLSNAFAQVLVVSAAEVVVCWTAIGSTVEAALLPYGRARAILGAATVSSILFGVYHFAHSPPFNNPAMVALLTIVGLVTSIVFFVSRSVYAATVLHTFLGVFGVAQALAGAGKLDSLAEPNLPLFSMALVTISALLAADLWIDGNSPTARRGG